MPPDFDEVVDALFLYRNKVLHCGLEWPGDDLNEFSSRLRKWPADWFSKVTLNDVPVIFLMTPAFVRRCFVLADQIPGGLIDFEEHNKELFAEVVGAPPEWLHADISATHEVTPLTAPTRSFRTVINTTLPTGVTPRARDFWGSRPRTWQRSLRHLP